MSPCVLRRILDPSTYVKGEAWLPNIDGASVNFSTGTDSAFNPYDVIARNVEMLQLADVAGTVGVWTPAHGNFLDYRISSSVSVSIEGAPDLTTAATFAGSLTGVDDG